MLVQGKPLGLNGDLHNYTGGWASITVGANTNIGSSGPEEDRYDCRVQREDIAQWKKHPCSPHPTHTHTYKKIPQNSALNMFGSKKRGKSLVLVVIPLSTCQNWVTVHLGSHWLQ